MSDVNEMNDGGFLKNRTSTGGSRSNSTKKSYKGFKLNPGKHFHNKHMFNHYLPWTDVDVEAFDMINCELIELSYSFETGVVVKYNEVSGLYLQIKRGDGFSDSKIQGRIIRRCEEIQGQVMKLMCEDEFIDEDLF